MPPYGNNEMEDDRHHRRDSSSFSKVLKEIKDETEAFKLVPKRGFSLLLAKRTKIIHMVRHAEGLLNVAAAEAGDDTPLFHYTPGA